jgi:MFS family permease
MLDKQFQKLTILYQEYPRAFWVLVLVTFVDRVGGALLFPFFALYLTKKFGVGMTQVGVLFAVFSFSSFLGSMIGGALTDRFGRKWVLIFSLVANSCAAVIMGLVDSFDAFFLLAAWVGIFTDVGMPAHQAMVADLLPEAKRTQGYGLLRVATNAAVTIGPAIGGFLATRSYLMLFIADAVISIIAALIVVFSIPETKPEAVPGSPEQTMTGSFRGYLTVLQDRIFMLFISVCVLVILVYMNINTTLGVYLRDTHAVPESGYGLLLSLNAIMVVFFQFPITRRIQPYPPMLMLALGTFLYAVGFTMYGFTTAYIMFLLAMVIITIGEMLVVPVSQSLVAHFAPQDMRGRYMAVFGFSWGIPFAVGPLLAGLIMDNYDQRWLWYACGLIGMLAVLGFLWLGKKVPAVSLPATQPAPE